MFGNNNNGQGILGFNMNPRTARGLQAAGLAMSQLAAGRPANLAPLHQQMLDEQRQAQMQEAIGPALERMPPEMRAVLASMPPQLAQQYIMQHMMQKPAASPIAGLEARARAAGLQPGTPEYQRFMLTGGGAPATSPIAGLEARARAAGLQPGTPEYQQFMLTGGKGGGVGGDEYGLTPQYVVDENDNIHLLQLSKNGDAKLVKIPEGMEVSRGLEKVDMGTHWQWVNKVTGEPVGEPRSKNIAEAAGEGEAGKTGIQIGRDAFKQATNVANQVRTFNRAIKALDEGGRSGTFDKYLPNVTAASAELRSAMNQAGLDVISAVTFGALSKGELDLAMDTAVPQNLDEPELRAWLVERADALDKTYVALIDYAEFMSKPGNTLDMWIEKNKREAEDSAPAVNDDDPLNLYGGSQ